MRTDSRSRQFQRPRKLHPLLCLLPDGYGSATVKRHEQVSVAKPWQRSVNKESWSEAEPFYGQTPLAGNVREGKRRKETCVRGRGKSPMDRSGDPMPDNPSLLLAEPDLPKPITQMEKEEKTSKKKPSNNNDNMTSSETCTVANLFFLAVRT